MVDACVGISKRRNTQKGQAESPGRAWRLALIDRHDKHATFINEIYENEDVGAFFRQIMLKAIYGKLTEAG